MPWDLGPGAIHLNVSTFPFGLTLVLVRKPKEHKQAPVATVSNGLNRKAQKLGVRSNSLTLI